MFKKISLQLSDTLYTHINVFLIYYIDYIFLFLYEATFLLPSLNSTDKDHFKNTYFHSKFAFILIHLYFAGGIHLG